MSATGILCPSCKRSASEVVETRRGYGRIMRRRACSCGYRYDTQETLLVGKKAGGDIAVIRRMRDKEGERFKVIAATLGVPLTTVWKRYNGL